MNSGKVESAKDNLNVETTMADDSMAFLESLGQQGGEDFLRSLAERVLAQLMECEVSNRLGAGKHARSEDRAIGMATGNGRCTRVSGRWTCRC